MIGPPTSRTIPARTPFTRRSFFREPAQASVVVGVLLGAVASLAAAQRPPAETGTGFVSGRVVDDSGRAVVGAEVVILALKLRTRSGASGQFRLDRVPLGNHAVLVRAIGFLPDTKLVQVPPQGASLGVVTLHPSAVVLPEIEAIGKLPSPAFGLGFATSVLDERYFLGDLNGRYLPFGASMTDDGMFQVLGRLPEGRAPERDSLPVVFWYMRPVDPNPFVPYAGAGLICYREAGLRRPVATRFDSDRVTGRVLFSDGTMWVLRLGLGRVDECRRSALLFLDRTPLSAAGAAGGWVVALEDPARAVSLVGIHDFGKSWTLPLAAVLATDQPVRDVILAPARGGVTVASSRPPFAWSLVDSSGSVILRSSPLTGRQADSLLRRAAREQWNGYAVLPVVNGFIQTFERAHGHEGAFVVYDILGRPVKALPRAANAPVLIASTPEMRMLLGFVYQRSGDARSRLFLYRY